MRTMLRQTITYKTTSYPSIYRWVALLIVSTAAFLSVVDLFIVNVALPSIREGIHGTNGDSQMVIALYLLGHAIFLITGGRFGDYYGHKKVFIWSMLLFTVASVCCAAAQNATQLNIARLLQGTFAAFMVPQSIAYIQFLFPEHHERAKALGIYGAIAGIASVLGQYLGGLLPEIQSAISGWRWLFLVNLPAGLLSAAAAAYWLKAPATKINGRPDYSGVLKLSLGLIALIYPLIRGRELGWPLWSVLLLPLSFVLLAWFIRDQYYKQKKGKQSLIDLQLFHNRSFNTGLMTATAYFIAQDSYFLINTVLLQTGIGLSPSSTGNYFVIQGVGYVVAAIFSIRLTVRYGKAVLQAGVLLMLTMLLVHILIMETAPADALLSATAYRQVFLAVLFLYGMGCGSVLPSLLTITLKKIPTHLASTAAGAYVTFQQISIALGVCITGGLFFQFLGAHPSLAQWLTAYRWATGANMFFLLVVAAALSVKKD
ncbi:MFS transporter [Chitinophaga pinensis]|uniref:Major facilitator superfamily MFS_1 n=1 Tax=Chitinophaga pinensis (strain ATCC 43595 / DSM 2588 / LMG 13176 / NBRC 15968 / NCIMB 11800 / UQM 2034) TaxID=485918 RepID=A0A979GTW2_CHIPD|nr:MFS transporter [Chitinophaga pinensis]ACU60126.1 major facilitator superfamily MFS_1 [Chitinophaga pinensis DSM 2588]